MWEKRAIAALFRGVGQWNGMIAALAGAMNHALRAQSSSGLSRESPIQQFSNFEHLEARGQSAIGELLKAFGGVR